MRRPRDPAARVRYFLEQAFDEINRVDNRDTINRLIGYCEARISHVDYRLRREIAESAAPEEAPLRVTVGDQRPNGDEGDDDLDDVNGGNLEVEP